MNTSRKSLAKEVIDQHASTFYDLPYDSNLFAVAASVGSGKTFTAIPYMLAAQELSHNILYVAPTHELLKQTHDDILKINNDVKNIKVIHSKCELHGETTTTAVLNAINGTEANSGSIILITTATLINIVSMLKNKKSWRVILDEGFNPLNFITYNLGKKEAEQKKAIEYFNNLFQVNTGDHNLVKPCKGKTNLIKGIAKGDWLNVGDMYKPMQSLSQMVTNGSMRVELAEQYERTYCFATYVTPESFKGFIEVIFLAALFEETILYKLWTHISGVKFNPHRYFEESISRDVHKDRGSLVSIGHILDKDDYSSRSNLERNHSTGKAKETMVGERVIDKALEITENYFNGNKYLLQINNWTGLHGELNNSLPSNCTLLSGSPQGQNKYKHIHSIATLAITNPPPYQKDWIQNHTGMTDSEIYTAYRIHTIYQAVGRTSIRNYGSSNPITVITTGYSDAQVLLKLFKGSNSLGKIGTIPKMTGRVLKFKPRKSDNPRYPDLIKERKRIRGKVNRGTAPQVDLDNIQIEINNFK